MLTRDQLADLYRGLQKEDVLSVYVDGVGSDPASRRVWRKKLLQEFEREEHRLHFSDSQEKEAFDSAKGSVLKDLEAFESFLPGKGYAAFSTADGIRHAESLPVQTPTLGNWPDTGSLPTGLRR